jgi:hypothetical protein
VSKNANRIRLHIEGPPCRRCRQPLEVLEHRAITAKLLAQPYYFRRWYNCANRNCLTTTITSGLADEFKVLPTGEPRPDPDNPGNVVWDGSAEPQSTSARPTRTFGEFTKAYYEQCARDGAEPECPF